MAKKIEVDLEQLEALAAKGYTARMCFEAIGISESKGYGDKEIMATIKSGAAKARQKVIDDLMARSEADQSSSASIFLAKQMRIYEEPFPTSTPKSPAEAIKKIGDIYKAVAENRLSGERGTYLIGFIEKYLKAYELSELTERIKALEEKQQ